MADYDDYFQTGWLSIWLGQQGDEDDLDDYLSGPFKRDFGFDWPWQLGPQGNVSIDPIAVDSLVRQAVPAQVDKLDEALAACRWTTASSIVVFYNLKYRGEAPGTVHGMMFFGAFEYPSKV